MIKELTMEKTSLPAGWEMKKLIELGEVQTGTTPSTSNKGFYGDFIPFVKPPHFNPDGTISFSSSGLSEIGLAKGRLIKENSILMVCIGASIGKTGITPIPISCNQQINAFSPNENCFPKFYYHLLSSDYFFRKVMKRSSQATLPMINKTKWQNIEIPLPPLPQQKQIVALLDKAFAAIDTARANAEQNLQNAKELRISITNNLFNSVENSDVLTVDEITDFITDYVANGSFASLKENVSYKSEKDYAMLLRLVDHSKKYQNPFVYVDKHAFDFLKKSTVYPNDIILSNVGARLGTAFRAPNLGIPMTLGPNSILIKAKEFGDYFFCWLQSAYGQNAIKSVVSGAGQPKFNKTQFKQIKVPIPKSKDDRDNIILKINQANNYLDKLESFYKQKLTDLEEMKKSILQKAFSGQLNTIN